MRTISPDGSRSAKSRVPHDCSVGYCTISPPEARTSGAELRPASLAPVNLEMPDRLVEALDGYGPAVHEAEALAATEIVHA